MAPRPTRHSNSVKTRSPIAVCLLIHAATVHAGPHSSANYSIATDIIDSGGGHSTSADYTCDASLDGIEGTSTSASPARTLKHGYIGQLYEVGVFELFASASTVNEGTSRQVVAGNLLDDMTLLPIPGSSVTWSILSGPLTFISTAGLATAGVVYESTNATVQGSFGGSTATLQLGVIDSNPDNIGSYAGDGLADYWQIQHFGFNNPLAAPDADATGTGQTNLFKFVAGLNPVDRTAPNAVFTLNVLPVPGQPNQMVLVFTPRLTSRTYTVKSTSSLSAPTWAPLTNFSLSDIGDVRSVTDLDATGTTKSYRIEITKP